MPPKANLLKKALRVFRNIPGVPKNTIHCLISCNVKHIKTVSTKQKAFHSQRINLDFNMSQFIFHAILTKIQVLEFARGFRNWRKNVKNCPHQGKMTAVAILHGIFLMSVILSL